MGYRLKDIRLDPDKNPWERQPGESDKRYGHFTAYRDLGRRRTLAQAAENLALHPAYVRALAAAGQWQVRAAAWDAHQDELFALELADTRRRAARNDARLLDAVIHRVAQALQTVDPTVLTPNEMIRCMDVALRHRRLLLGDATDNTHLTISGPGGGAIQVEMDRFKELPAEAQDAQIHQLVQATQRRLRAVNATSLDDDE
ncbi:MAG: hypothetical protein J2P26_02025 [Nocardiopsaceae bacterium]|nr:hypothetical protein [Nocardiopsaceae bacterium]